MGTLRVALLVFGMIELWIEVGMVARDGVDRISGVINVEGLKVKGAMREVDRDAAPVRSIDAVGKEMPSEDGITGRLGVADSTPRTSEGSVDVDVGRIIIPEDGDDESLAVDIATIWVDDATINVDAASIDGVVCGKVDGTSLSD